MPSTNTIGKNTATVVSVLATTAPATRRTPSTAASLALMPCSRQRLIDSSTTIELSTSMPTPRARPPSDMTLSVMFDRNIGANVTTKLTGIDTAMIAVGAKRRRNR